jgi:hypothetical protein
MTSKLVIDNIPWMWKEMFGEEADSWSIVGFFETLAKQRNMSLEEYIVFKKAKRLLAEEVE